MSLREDVVRLVDSLSRDDLLTARRLLRGLVATPEPDALALRALLDACPPDDEGEDGAERSAVDHAWDEYRAGQQVPHERVLGKPTEP